MFRHAICNETFADWPLDRACGFAAECGYTGLEIAPFTLGDRPTALSAAERSTIRRTVERAGLEVIGLHWLLAKTEDLHVTHPDAQVRRRTTEYLADLARLSADLGGTILVFGSPKQRSLTGGVDAATAIDHLRGVCEGLIPTLDVTGTLLALEPLTTAETDVLTTAAETCRLIETVDSPFVRLHLDVKAMSSEDESIPDVIRRSHRHLVHFHANDANLQGPGFGDIDFRPIFKALEEVAYRGWVSVEVFDLSPGIERLVRESLVNMLEAESA